jgi:DNA repair exonuclease SbcCD ATPase subunit
MAIKRTTYIPKNRIYVPANTINISQYYSSEMSVTLEYFTIIDKVINNYKENKESNITKEKENLIQKNEPILVRTTNRGSSLEPYKEKSFFENASFFLSTVKTALRTVSLDTKIDEINEYKESLKVYSMAKGVYYSENETFRNIINKFFRKHPDYKQANDEFDRLQDEKTQKIKQLNNLIIELNNFRQFILDEYNPIVLELLDLLEEDESKIKIEYMNFLGKLYQKINYSFKSTSSKDITKSDMLLKCDELKSNIEILEKDNKELDNEIVKILENASFKNYKSQNLEYFHTTKVKLNSLIKQNTPKINKLPKVEKDEELENLKKELKSLEEKLQNLAIEKTEYLKDIEEFNIQYNIHLGDIIKSILSLKKEILYKKTIKYQKIKDTYEEEIKTFDETKDTIIELKETISELEEALENIDKDDENYDEIYKAYQELQEELENLEDELYSQEQKLDETREQLEDDELFNEYEDVKSAYKEFENEYEHIKDNQKDTIKLNDDEKVEIKKLYKKAARLCHPDIVSDELKEKAHEIMQALNDAYSKKDITKVKEILLNLETGISFEVSSNSIEDKEILKAKIEEFKKTIQELKNEIEEIKSDDTFITISSLDDWDIYFEGLKKDLEEEKEKLEVEAQEILEDKEDKELDSDLNIVQDILKEQTIDSESCISTIKYLSTSEIARQHNMQAKPHLFDELLELKLLYKDNKSYKLTDKGKKIGGNYKSSDKGEEWVVWEENSLNKIIEDLKIKLGLNSSEIQKKV